jgi:hypothetical protein
VVAASPRSSVAFSPTMIPLASSDFSAALSVVRSRTPQPASRRRPSRVTMPRVIWPSEIGSRSRLKPKVRRTM